jgi:hypothetical protein
MKIDANCLPMERGNKKETFEKKKIKRKERNKGRREEKIRAIKGVESHPGGTTRGISGRRVVNVGLISVSAICGVQGLKLHRIRVHGFCLWSSRNGVGRVRQ